MLRYQHILALLWFHFLNHIRRIVATYVFPLLLIALGALLIVLYNKDPEAVKATLDDDAEELSWNSYAGDNVCDGEAMKLEDFYEKNVDGTIQVGIFDGYDSFSVR